MMSGIVAGCTADARHGGFWLPRASSGASALLQRLGASRCGDQARVHRHPSPGPFPIELLTSRWWTIPWSVSIDIPPDELANHRRGRWWSHAKRAIACAVPVRQISSSAPWYGRGGGVFTPDFRVETGSYHIEVTAPGYRCLGHQAGGPTPSGKDTLPDHLVESASHPPLA